MLCVCVFVCGVVMHPHLQSGAGSRSRHGGWKQRAGHEGQTAISLCVHVRECVCLSAAGGAGRHFSPGTVLKKRPPRRWRPPTRDVHVHDAGAGPDAVGGVADVRPGQVVGHRALEEQGVVFDFHISGERAVQAGETEKKKKMAE